MKAGNFFIWRWSGLTSAFIVFSSRLLGGGGVVCAAPADESSLKEQSVSGVIPAEELHDANRAALSYAEPRRPSATTRRRASASAAQTSTIVPPSTTDSSTSTTPPLPHVNITNLPHLARSEDGLDYLERAIGGEWAEIALLGGMFLLGVCGIYWCGGVDGVQKKIGRVKIIERLRRLDKKRSECAICCCDFEVGVKVARTQCGHLFHYDCLAEWAATGNNTCPLCREPIDIDLGDGIASAATIEVAAAVASIEAEAVGAAASTQDGGTTTDQENGEGGGGTTASSTPGDGDAGAREGYAGGQVLAVFGRPPELATPVALPAAAAGGSSSTSV
mmetsp:Transcript_22235/g.56105  ORF Transcript_22235/g.56105 Transcript_22235/m.56105 type:complete len:333 (-) Transcript_22235:622-1620(-)